MKRRSIISIAGGVTLGVALPVLAQTQPQRVMRVGRMGSLPASIACMTSSPVLPATCAGLTQPVSPPPPIMRWRTASSWLFHWARVSSAFMHKSPCLQMQ